MVEWRDQEHALETALSAASRPITGANVLTVERISCTREQGAFSVPYAELSGTRSTAENGAFELRYGWCRSLAYVQKAL